MWESLAHAAWIERIGWTLVHSLWQFVLVALAAVAIERVLARRTAATRYRALLVIMCVAVAMPVATWFSLPPVDRSMAVVATDPMDDEEDFSRPRRSVALQVEGRAPSRPPQTTSPPPQTTSPPPQTTSPPPERAFSDAILPRDAASPSTPRGPAFSWATVKNRLAPWLPAIVVVWFAGVLVTALRPLLGWRTVRRLKTVGVSPAGGPVRGMVESLTRRFHLARAVEVLQSTLVKTPMVVGYLRPVVLLPLGMVTGLPAAQLEMILAHELAHVCRHDYLFNLLQTLVETLFFYHPAVWWLSREIRNERENCCDDVAMATVGSRIDYGRALLAVAELRAESPALSVAARGGSLLGRIQRITGCEPAPQVAGGVGVVGAILVAVAVGGAVAWGSAGVEKSKPSSVAADTAGPASKKTTESPADTKTEKSATTRSDWKAGQVIDFRVIQAKTKEPLSGVKLLVMFSAKGRDLPSPSTQAMVPSGRGSTRPRWRDLLSNTNQTTDAQGRCEIRLPDRRPDAVRVYTSKAGFVPLRVYWGDDLASPTLPKNVTVSLEPGTVWGGIIQNEKGEPIPNVKVNLYYCESGSSPNPHLRVNIRDEEVSTDKDGRWRIDVIPAAFDGEGPRLYLTHPDYVSDHLQWASFPLPVYERPSYKSLRDQTAVIVMRKGTAITGRVTDELAKPIAGALICNAYDCYGPGALKFTATTDNKGEFRLSGLSHRQNYRDYFFTVQAAGYAPVFVELSDIEDRAPVEVKLKRGQAVQGQVVDPNGKPIQKASITLDYWQGHPQQFYFRTTTDTEGRFRLNDAPWDATEYDIDRKGYMTVRRPLPPSTDDYVITLRRPVRVSGSITDAETGQPLAKCKVMQGHDYRDGRAPAWWRLFTRTVTNGRYEVDLTQEQYTLRIRMEAKGYMPAVSPPFDPSQIDKQHVTYDFKLRKAAPMTGTVVDSDGNPLADAQVIRATQSVRVENRKATVSTDNFNNNRTTRTDAMGYFTFPPEVEPFYLVVLHDRGRAVVDERQFAKSSTIRIEPWTADNGTFQAERRPSTGSPRIWSSVGVEGALLVRLVDLDGKPVEGAHVSTSAEFRAWADRIEPYEVRWNYFPNIISNSDGMAGLPAHSDYVVARHVERKLVAMQSIRPEQARRTDTITITMYPECKVFGKLTSKGLEARGRKITSSNVCLYLDSGYGRPMSCMSHNADFHLYVPPGTYRLDAYGAHTKHAEKTITVKPGQQELEVEPIDLPAEPLILLEGQPAPELRDVVTWKNGGPLKLTDLHGKVVILAFSCGWSGEQGGSMMPVLFPIYKKYRDLGLTIVEIRVDGWSPTPRPIPGPKTAAQLKAEATEVREPFWKEGHIPAPIALVPWLRGPLKPDSRTLPIHPVLEDYGVDSLPSAMLIDRQGRVVGRFYPLSKPNIAVLERLLNEKQR